MILMKERAKIWTTSRAIIWTGMTRPRMSLISPEQKPPPKVSLKRTVDIATQPMLEKKGPSSQEPEKVQN